MLHPLFSTLVQRPDLLLEHVSAYAALFNEEARVAGLLLLKRSLTWALAALCGTAFVVLAGIALMLGFLQNQFHWILVLVPGVTLILTVVAIIRAMTHLPSENFPALQAQLDNDVCALRIAA